MPRYIKASDKAVAEAIVKNRGLCARAARELGISHQSLRRRIFNNQKLKEVFDSVTEFNLDEVESSLYDMVTDKNVTAAIFYLKCKGKHRGWIENDPNPDHTEDMASALKDIAKKLPD